jgi:hypothetical protein
MSNHWLARTERTVNDQHPDHWDCLRLARLPAITFGQPWREPGRRRLILHQGVRNLPAKRVADP